MKAETTRGKFSNPKPDLVKEVMETTKEAPHNDWLDYQLHGWDYRRYVTSKLSSTVDDSKSIIESEFDFTTVKINQNFSNYSAWHQRSKLLPLLIEERNYNSEEIKTFIDKEFDLVKSAFYTDPDDQSAWLYYWWLVGGDGIQRRKYITNLPSNTIPESKFKPLDGIRVLELGQLIAGPFCGTILGIDLAKQA
ncbi:20339_t:CDS:2 [Entrophospora sp. SA101]|nr:20339_t:CDS:2 [Entrophospora sp. SA101]